MAYKRLLDRQIPPDATLIEKTIGPEVFPVWRDALAYLSQAFPDYETEQLYYSVQHGWALRYRRQLNQLVLLFPEHGAFSVLLILNPEEDLRALQKIDFFNRRIREVLNQASALPQGRWLWLRLEDHTDLNGLKLLLDIKAQSII